MIKAIEEDKTRSKADNERLFDDLDDWIDRQDVEVFEDRPIGQLAWRACRAINILADLAVWEFDDWGTTSATNAHPAAATPPGVAPLDGRRTPWSGRGSGRAAG